MVSGGGSEVLDPWVLLEEWCDYQKRCLTDSARLYRNHENKRRIYLEMEG